MQVYWGNRMEVLADAMFAHLLGGAESADAEGVFARRDIVVVPSRLVQHWLLHRFLYRDRDEPVPRVLADIEFPLLNIFVNDWLARMEDPGEAARDPLEHPFSVAALQWRLYRLLVSARVEDPVFAPLLDYVRSGPLPGDAAAVPSRAFRLAGRLAAMFDEYMVYRPAMLGRWESGSDGALDARLRWQPALWRLLVEGPLRERTYLAAFRRMESGLARSALPSVARAVHVFGVSMMPPVFIRFFELMGERLPVRLYALNPCRRDWFDDPGGRDSRLEGRLDAEPLLSAGNAFLSDQGRGCRDLLAELLDRTQGQAEAGALFVEPPAATVLDRLHRDLLDGVDADPADPGATMADGSVQLHVCHGPLREVEILRDHLLRWFTEDPALQPREVQVQVSDMAAYAPYIEAVFGAAGAETPTAIPFVIADRVAAGESAAAEGFRRLLELAGSRFTAPGVLDLLHIECVRAAFGIGAADLAEVRRWVERAGIRWGRDAAHRREVLGTEVDPPAATTWRHGLDRLLLGYAGGGMPESVAVAGEVPLPSDQVGDELAVVLGRVAAFYEHLCRIAAWCRGRHAPGAWADRIETWITGCLAATEANYRDLGELRKVVAALRKSALAAGVDEEVGLDVVQSFLSGQIRTAVGGGDLVQNAVVFSALRPGSSLPRRRVCLLGMSDGMFPRRENRAHYDLFRTERRMGDRSQRTEDRQAFLEAVLSAREGLYLSYTGFAPGEGGEMPPAAPVEGLGEHLSRIGGGEAFQVVRHRLQGHHPSYFDGRSALFSCSRGDCRAAQALLAPRAPMPPPGEAADTGWSPPVAGGGPVPLELDAMVECLGNPARHYFTRILKVRLEPETDAATGDSEEFDPGARAGYAVNQSLVAALLEDPPLPPPLVRRRLEEDGLLPLLHAGEHWFARRLEQVRALLDRPVSTPPGERLGDVVRRSMRTPALPLTVDLGGIRISGCCRLMDAGGAAPMTLDGRWARSRAVDRLAAWLRHLFVSAAGIAETRLYLAGKPEAPGAVEEIRFAPLGAGEAAAWLRPLAEACLAAGERLLPFTPETSWAYVKAVRKAGDDAAASGRGLDAARKAWEPTQGDGDMRNVYFRRAFGPEGPCARPREFAALAEGIAGPLADAIL